MTAQITKHDAVPGPRPPGGHRSTKADRRAQLLDAAAQLISDRGIAAFTMEGLAVAAGVSKALPYQHFANANDALIALMAREVAHLGRAMTSASDGIDDADQMIAAAITAYFDIVAERGGLLNALAGPGSSLPELATGGTRTPPTFLLELLKRGYSLKSEHATFAAWIVTSLAIAGSDSIARDEGPRSTIEPLTVAAIIASIRTVVDGSVLCMDCRTSALGSHTT